LNTWETAAVIRLIDHLSAPLGQLAGKVEKEAEGMSAKLQRISHRTAEVGRSMTFSLTLPIAEALKFGAEQAEKFSEVSNTMNGILRNRAAVLGLAKDATEQFVSSQSKALQQDALDSNKNTGGLTDFVEYRRAQMAALSSGHDPEGATAIANLSTYLALANRIPQSEAAEYLIKISNAFGVQTKNIDGTTKSVEELQAALGPTADLMAMMTKNSTMSAREVFEGLKYAAPYAEMMHMDNGTVGAMLETLADRGFVGSEGGIAFRSLANSLLKPKSAAIPTLQKAGLNYYDYVKMTPDFQLSGGSIAAYARARGYQLSEQEASAAIKRAQGKAHTENGEWDLLGPLQQELIGRVLRKSGKTFSPITPIQAEKFVNDFLSTSVQEVNLPHLIAEARKAHGGQGLTGGEWGRIGEGRQFPRLMALLQTPQGLDILTQSLERMYGKEGAQAVLRGEKVQNRIAGAAQRQAEEHQEGLEGAFGNFKRALTDLNAHLDNAGFYKRLEDLTRALTRFMHSIASMDPHNLDLLATGLVSLGALGPGVWVGGKLLELSLGLGRFAASIVLLEGAFAGLVAVAGHPLVLAFLAALMALKPQPANAGENEAVRQRRLGQWVGPGLPEAGLPYAGLAVPGMSFGLEGPRAFRYSTPGLEGKVPPELPGIDPKTFPTIAPSGEVPTFARPDPDRNQTLGKIEPQKVEVHGEAEVNVKSHVEVYPSPDFLTRVTDGVNQRIKMPLGHVGPSMAGSNTPVDAKFGLGMK